MLLAVANAVPPLAAAYQSIVILPDIFALTVTVPLPQREAPVPVGADGKVVMVAVTAVLDVETQPAVVFLASA